MSHLIKYLPILRNKTKFIQIIPLRDFSHSPINVKGRPLPTQSKCPSIIGESQPKIVYNFFRSIQKINCVTLHDVKSKELQDILRMTVHEIPHMNGYEILQILIGIIHNNTLRNHEINDVVVKALLPKIEDVPIHVLAFFDYFVRKLKLMDFYKEILLRIRTQFVSKSNKQLKDVNDIRKVKQILIYMKNNVECVSPEMLNMLATNLMKIHDTKLDIDVIKDVIFLLSQFNHLSQQSIDTFNKMVKLWCERKPQFRDVELLVSLLAQGKTINKEALEEAGLIPFIFKFLKNEHDEKTLGSLNCLIEMGYGQQCIDIMSQHFEKVIFHSNVHFFIDLCSACEKCEYRPANWKSIIMPALKNFEFQKYIEQYPNFHWPSFVLKLHSLGYDDVDLIKALVKSPKFFNWPDVEMLENIISKKSHGYVVTEGPEFAAKIKLSHRIDSRLSSLNGKNVDSKGVVEFFQSLKETKNVSANDMQHLTQFINQMTADQLLAIMIGIINFKQLQNHPVNRCVMNAFIPQIRNLQFKDVAFVDYRIHRMSLNASYEKLQLEIKIFFLENIHRILDECHKFENLLMTTAYMKDNINIISSSVLNRYADILIMANGCFKVQDIINVLVIFSCVNLENRAIEALNKMVEMWCKCKLQFKDVEILILEIVHKQNQYKVDKRAFESSGLIRFIYNYLNESNDSRKFDCIELLKQMGNWDESIESTSKKENASKRK